MTQARRLGDRYELGDELGRGGMAEVVEAQDLRLGRRVAIKLLRPDLARDPSFQARFRREAQSAAALNHPNIVAVYDTGEDQLTDGAESVTVPFIVMEYVDGVTLRQLLSSGRRLLPERALEITAGILAALDYSHRHGIVHRDIKPANVMLTRGGEVKVMDFGIARAIADSTSTMTAASTVMGTAQYLSPEQARGEVVLSRGGDAATVVWPRNANGTVEIPNQGKFFLQDLVSSGRARTSSEAPGGYEFDLVPGSKARVEFASGLTFQVSAVNAGKAIPVAWAAGIGAAGLMYVALSFLAHTGLFSAMAFFMPAMGADDSDALDRDQLLRMRHYLDAAAEREQEEKETPKDDNANADNKEGGTGTRAKGEEGSMGNPTTKATGHKYGIQGPQDNQDPHIARQAALKEAAEFGMIGLLNTGAGGDPNAPTAPWGREDSLGNDPMSARGNMWGDTIGDSFGAGGLGLSGVGEGGGGRGEGIGLGNIGTFGHGAGTGTGQGFGSGHGRLGGSHQTRAPSIRQGATTVNGRLPPEVIQRIVRQNFGRFKLCYEDGLRKNPSLQGRVAVKFVIDRSGAVSTAQDGGSEIQDPGVVQCVVRGFNNLSFPQPEGGIGTVVYPIIFTPGD